MVVELRAWLESRGAVPRGFAGCFQAWGVWPFRGFGGFILATVACKSCTAVVAAFRSKQHHAVEKIVVFRPKMLLRPVSDVYPRPTGGAVLVGPNKRYPSVQNLQSTPGRCFSGLLLRNLMQFAIAGMATKQYSVS